MDMILRSLLRDLVLAVEQNDREHVELLLSSSLWANAPDGFGRKSAFFAAVESGQLEMVHWLIEHMPHPDFPDIDIGNSTPLSYVIHELGEEHPPIIRQRWLAMMECLLEAGADPTAGTREGEPLVLSRLYGMKDIEKILEIYNCSNRIKKLGRFSQREVDWVEG